MSFCMAGRSGNQSYILFIYKKIKNHLRNIVTLQVRILSNLSFCYRAFCHDRKAFLPISFEGSLTLETALTLSLFIFASVCLILPMKVMNTERDIQAMMEQIGEDFSKYAYLKDAIQQGKDTEVKGAEDSEKGFCDYLVGGAGIVYAKTQITKNVDTDALKNVTMIKSRIMMDEAWIDLVLDYEIELPFPVLGLSSLKRTARCRRRAWVGLEGKDYDKAGEDAEDEGDIIVYIGKSKGRYHLSRSCHYLSNNLKAVSRSEVTSLRNSSGGKYYPCAVCGSKASETVYITSSGGSYHTDPDCRSMISYVKAVKLSEVKHLGACSYCGKK